MPFLTNLGNGWIELYNGNYYNEASVTSINDNGSTIVLRFLSNQSLFIRENVWKEYFGTLNDAINSLNSNFKTLGTATGGGGGGGGTLSTLTFSDNQLTITDSAGNIVQSDIKLNGFEAINTPYYETGIGSFNTLVSNVESDILIMVNPTDSDFSKSLDGVSLYDQASNTFQLSGKSTHKDFYHINVDFNLNQYISGSLLQIILEATLNNGDTFRRIKTFSGRGYSAGINLPVSLEFIIYVGDTLDTGSFKFKALCDNDAEIELKNYNIFMHR